MIGYKNNDCCCFTMVFFIRYKEDLVALVVDEAHCGENALGQHFLK